MTISLCFVYNCFWRKLETYNLFFVFLFHLCMYLFIYYLFIHIFIYLSIYSFIYLFIYLSTIFYLLILFIYIFIYLYIYLFIYLFTYLTDISSSGMDISPPISLSSPSNFIFYLFFHFAPCYPSYYVLLSRFIYSFHFKVRYPLFLKN